jgi:hypothetical protein
MVRSLSTSNSWTVREYSKAVQAAMNSLGKQDLSFINSYRFQVSDIHTDMLNVNPSPTGKEYLWTNQPTSAHLNSSNPEKKGRKKDLVYTWAVSFIPSITKKPNVKTRHGLHVHNNEFAVAQRWMGTVKKYTLDNVESPNSKKRSVQGGGKARLCV